MKNRFVLWALLGLFTWSASAGARGADSVRTLNSKLSEYTPVSGANAKVQLARKLMRKKNYEAASALLETLYEQGAESSVVANLLFACYQRLGYFIKAEALSRRLIERDPKSYVNRLRLAEVLTALARLEEAEETYNEAVALVQRGDLPRYQTILKSMVGHGFDTLALALIDTVRAWQDDSTLFALDRGAILEGQSSYQQAAQEFFVALGDSGRTASDAEKKLLALLDYPQSSAEVEKTLLEKTDSAASIRTARILSSFYLRAERFDRAFSFAVLRDSLEGHEGRTLLAFVRSCQDRKLYDQLVRMAAYILSRYGDKPFVEETYFLYGDALVHLGRYDYAIETYNTVFATFPRVQDKAEALYRIGAIYLNYLNDYPRALSFFDSVITHYHGGLGFVNAKLAVPHCYLCQGLLDEARSSFENLLSGYLYEDTKEAVEYNLALILLYEQKFDSSKVALRKLLVDYPRGFYVNDAVQLLLLLDEAQDMPELLSDFSRALLFEQRRLPDSTMAELLLVANDSSRALADVALYKLAGLSLSRADSSAAVEFIDRLTKEFPESYYLPYSMKTKADICLTRLDGVEEAKAIYRRLLLDYPDYPFISEVRKTMRQLEGEA